MSHVYTDNVEDKKNTIYFRWEWFSIRLQYTSFDDDDDDPLEKYILENSIRIGVLISVWIISICPCFNKTIHKN